MSCQFPRSNLKYFSRLSSTLNGPWYGDCNGVSAVRRAHKCVLPTTTLAIHSYVATHRHTGGIGRSRRIFCRKSATNAGSAAISPSDDTKNSPGKRRGSPNTISATEHCKSFLTAARTPSNTNGSASTQLGSEPSFAFRADFIVRCMRSTNPFACGWCDVVVLVDVPSSDAVFVQRSDTNCLQRSLVKVDGHHGEIPNGIETHEHKSLQICHSGNDFRPTREPIHYRREVSESLRFRQWTN